MWTLYGSKIIRTIIIIIELCASVRTWHLQLFNNKVWINSIFLRNAATETSFYEVCPMRTGGGASQRLTFRFLLGVLEQSSAQVEQKPKAAGQSLLWRDPGHDRRLPPLCVPAIVTGGRQRSLNTPRTRGFVTWSLVCCCCFSNLPFEISLHFSFLRGSISAFVWLFPALCTRIPYWFQSNLKMLNIY